MLYNLIKEKTRPLRRWFRAQKREFIKWYYPKKLADILFQESFGRNIDWNNPRDLNEKIQWLMFNSDISEWARLADKYRVREFVKERGCEDILIPLYGKWDRAEDIDWNSLPNSFVIKVNHGSGDTHIVIDKSKADLIAIQNYMREALSKPYGIESAEIHYRKIKPCIIAEQLLSSSSITLTDNGLSNKAILSDYKIWCFHGVPYCIFTCTNRNLHTHEVVLNVYDLKWNRHDEWISEPYRNNIFVEMPHCLNEMIEYARKLSNGFPQVRVDFYECNNKIYFGEMTFTSACGRMDYFTQEFLKEMGDKVILPQK